MISPKKFSFENLYSKHSESVPVQNLEHADYDFAIAYPTPETLPMHGLIQALQEKMDSDGQQVTRDMAYYPHVLGSPDLRQFTSENSRRIAT